MRTETIQVFQFSELSQDAKQVAIEKHRDINVNYEWWEFIYEDAKNIGLTITGFDLDRNRQANGEFILSANEVAANVLKEHGETCETHKTAANFMEVWQPLFNEYMDETSEHYESNNRESELQELEDDFLKSLVEDYSIILQNEYEYLMEDEAVIETIEANEYEFTQDGKRY